VRVGKSNKRSIVWRVWERKIRERKKGLLKEEEEE
jgi:hypothetical protein